MAYDAMVRQSRAVLILYSRATPTMQSKAVWRTDFLGLTGHQLAGVTYSTRSSLPLTRICISLSRTVRSNRRTAPGLFIITSTSTCTSLRKAQGRGSASSGVLGPLTEIPTLCIISTALALAERVSSADAGSVRYRVLLHGHQQPQIHRPVETREFLRDEYGIEAYYSFAITPWMKLTPDIQVVRGAQKETVESRESAASGYS